MDSTVILMVLGAVVAITIPGRKVWRQYKLRRRLTDTPESRVVEVRDGERVRITGELLFDEVTLEAPFSLRRCALFEAIVKSTDHNNQINIQQLECVPFRIRTPEGEVYVKPILPELILHRDAHYRSGFLKDAPERFELFLRRHGKDSKTLVGFNRSLSYREGVLEEQERVSVFGKAYWEKDPRQPPSPSLGYRQHGKRLVMEGTSLQPLIISDDPIVVS